MKTGIIRIAIGLGFLTAPLAHAQDTNIDWSAASDLQVELQAIEQVPPMPADDVTNGTTFWSAQHAPGSAEPWAPLPGNILGMSAWDLGDGTYLLDDLGYRYHAHRRHKISSQNLSGSGEGMTMADDDGPVLPGDDDDDTNDYSPAGLVGLSPDYGTNLYIAQVSQASGMYSGIISNTISQNPYEIQYTYDLLSTNWQSADWIFPGSEVTNWTTFSVPMISPTNMFFRVRSWESDDGSGLPTWWEDEYFGTNAVDPNAQDAADDGWTIYQKYTMGLNPNTFYTPPTPEGMAVSFDQSNNIAAITWPPSPGAVTNYIVERDVGYGGSTEDFNVLPDTNYLSDDISSVQPDPYNDGVLEVSYKIEAQYVGGNSAWSASVPLQQIDVSASIVPGADGTTILEVSGLPANATAVQLVYYDRVASIDYGDFSYNTNIDIPVSDFINGEYVLPSSLQSLGEDAYNQEVTPDLVQSVSANGDTSAENQISNNSDSPPFYDGRVQMKQNLIFLLRSASVDYPFGFTEDDTNDFYGSDGGEYIFNNPTDYAWASPYRSTDDSYQFFSLDPTEPFDDNYRYLNFVFNTTELNGYGYLQTGVSWSDGLDLNNPTYEFIGLASQITNSVLATNQTRWLVADWSWYGNPFGGIITNAGASYSMASNARNYFGLPYLSAELAYPTSSGVETGTLFAGGNFTLPSSAIEGPLIYPETAQPGFQTVEYDFWNPATYTGYIQPGQALVPGMPGFSPTNQSQLLITPVGSPLDIVGYAKLAVTNGYPGVYAYLGQYFTNAYQIDGSGSVTTNSVGILSPYGNFLPTEPGPTALLTMPDPDTGEQGTCTVYCVGLNVDANHDGNMDLSFNGSDVTSQANPMEFWVNDGCDVPGTGGNLDYDLPVPPASPNCISNQITCSRDLENFARLWICGMPSIDVPEGYQVTLSWQNYTGNPAITLYPAYEADGGIGYLTNSTIAQDNIGYPTYGEVSPGTNLVFSDLFFENTGTKHFLFEGAGIGKGQLTMTITQNGNTIAQTSVWLDLHDIKDFYERAVITNDASGAISNWTSGLEAVQPATASATGNDTNIIVMVHGINVGNWNWLDDSEAVFKRLYWAGYQGQFSTVKWPCNYLTPPQPLTLSVFNLSEAHAYKSSTALTTYLDQLRSRFPGYLLNIFAHSQGNAVASEAVKNGAPCDTYILTQAAITDGAYDTNATNYPDFIEQEEGGNITPEWQPMGYQGVYTNLTGKVVNFYNPNDPVLDVWNLDQEYDKPSGDYSYDGTNCWYTDLFTTYLVTDFQETRSMVSRARSLSLGQSGPESAHGIVQAAVDLHANYGFDNAFPADHSAQWTWPIQTTLPYYSQILIEISPAP